MVKITNYIKENWMVGTCSTRSRDEKYMQHSGWKSFGYEVSWEADTDYRNVW
jgi:hypothetical protein